MIDSHRSIQRGGAIQCARLACDLSGRGHQVTCIFDGDETAGFSGKLFANMIAAGVELKRYPFTSLYAMYRLRKWLHENPPDILHTHKNRALFFGVCVLLGRPKPPWFANRGTVYPLSRNRLAYFFHRRYIRQIIAVSHAVRDVLIADSIQPEKVQVIYGSFDQAAFDPAIDGSVRKTSWGISRDTVTVGMLASLCTPKKGHTVFLEAATLLHKKFPQLHYVLAGEGNPCKLQEQADRLGIADKVHFPGFIEEAPDAFAALDVVVCASLRGEGLTGSVREALAMERPVVSTDVAGNNELVVHEETGLLVPPGDPVALAAAVVRLLENRVWARQLANAGRKKVLFLCTGARRVEQIETLYLQALSGVADDK